jgi:hypothetical protein
MQAALPLFFALMFLMMGVITFYIVEKRKKEQMRRGETYYMSMDLVGMILLMGACLAFSIIAPLGRHLLCLNGLLQ